MSTRLPIVIGPTGQQQQVQAGDTLKVQPSTTGGASLSIPHGTAPSSPNNGDFWSTTSGFYGRVNGATVGPFGSGGGIADADYGDVVVSSSGTVWTIDANVVSNAKLRQSAGLSVVGRSANTTGNVADITATTDQVLRESGGTLGFGTVATAGIANAAVTLAKIASASASSKLLGSGASGSGAAYAELTLGTGLSMSGTTLNASGGSGTVTTTGSPSSGNLAAFSGSTSITNSTVNAFLDSEFSSTQGAVLYRGASAWAALSPGSAGQVLQTNGASVNPSWATPSGGAVTTAAPGLIPDLLFWYESDDLLAASGTPAPALRNRTPAYEGAIAIATGKGASLSATALNGRQVITFPGGANGRYGISNGAGFRFNAGATMIFIYKPASLSTIQALISGGSGSLEIRTTTAGKVELLRTNVASLAVSATALTVSTWTKLVVQFNPTSGAYTISANGSSLGSGTSAGSIDSNTNAFGYNATTNNEDLNADLAVILCYNRILSAGELTALDTYTMAKWGL